MDFFQGKNFCFWAMHDPEQDIPLDIIVEYNGVRYYSTLFTLANVDRLIKLYASTGECLGGMYFCSKNMIIVKDYSLETIFLVIEEILVSRDYRFAFGLD